jgi:hypothetical protein
MRKISIFFWLLMAGPALADPSTGTFIGPHMLSTAPEEDDKHVLEASESDDDLGIIPQDAQVYISTSTLIPISELPERPAYQQAQEELEQAKALWSKGHAEAASDMALQAYDDLYSIKTPRGKRNRKKRAKLRAQRATASYIYVDSSLAYIRSFVRSKGDTPAARAEGAARMEDLRDVARDYPDLNSKLNRAIEQMRS